MVSVLGSNRNQATKKNTVRPSRSIWIWNTLAEYQKMRLGEKINLPTLNIRFWKGKIVVTSDKEAMFSRIRMTKEDARYHRFLSRQPGSKEVITYQMDPVTFRNCCFPFIAIYATRRAADDFGNRRTAIKREFAGDYLDTTKTEEEIVTRAMQVKYIKFRWFPSHKMDL